MKVLFKLKLSLKQKILQLVLKTLNFGGFYTMWLHNFILKLLFYYTKVNAFLLFKKKSSKTDLFLIKKNMTALISQKTWTWSFLFLKNFFFVGIFGFFDLGIILWQALYSNFDNFFYKKNNNNNKNIIIKTKFM